MKIYVFAAVLTGVGLALAPATAQRAGGRQAEKVTPAPWPPEKLSDGQPDIQGYWDPSIGGTYSLTDPPEAGSARRNS